jgi:hypothetical protein
VVFTRWVTPEAAVTHLEARRTKHHVDRLGRRGYDLIVGEGNPKASQEGAAHGSLALGLVAVAEVLDRLARLRFQPRQILALRGGRLAGLVGIVGIGHCPGSYARLVSP